MLKMKTMKDYFEMLTEQEQRYCTGQLGGINETELITWILASHLEELTLEEYATFKHLALDIGRTQSISNIEYILAETNGIDVH